MRALLALLLSTGAFAHGGQGEQLNVAMQNRKFQLGAELALRNEELGTSGVRLWAAPSRHESAKAKLVKDKNPTAGTDIDTAAFDEKVTTWQAREQAVLAALQEREHAMRAARDIYIDLAVKLQTASQGAYGGPWADLLD